AQEQDTTYIQDFGQALQLKLPFTFRDFNYKVGDTGLPSARYRSNSMLFVGIGAVYRNLQLQLLVPVAKFRQTDNDFDTKAIDFNIGLKTNFLNGNAYIKEYKGFSVLTDNNSEEVYLPEAVFLKIGVNGFLNLNSDFSMVCSYKQSQRQLKATGSFLPGINAYYMENYYPDNSPEYTELNNVGPLLNFNLLAGYAFNFPIRTKYIISPLAFVGGGMYLPANEQATGQTQGFSFLYNARLLFGYIGDKWVYGAIAEVENSFLTGSDYTFNHNSIFVKFSIGYRMVY
ncbi:MAG: DUF4421 family protein, partial [Bacteroidota bacterium]|nr:DUF4421 family protein [Bacteroidota bacterium]